MNWDDMGIFIFWYCEGLGFVQGVFVFGEFLLFLDGDLVIWGIYLVGVYFYLFLDKYGVCLMLCDVFIGKDLEVWV